MSKKKIISSKEQVSSKMDAWLHPLLEERLGERELTEYLWSTSYWQSICPVAQGSLESHEYRLVLIDSLHRWVSAHRGEIRRRWEEKLASVSEEERKELLYRPFRRIHELKSRRFG